mmetsp:Transcript_5782/g.20942  ORF Transcript_5782/g.20942 Transcript_5782/m.20942 type:complete len:82 (+) Transcript_5782:4390-4635(+)
MKPDMTPTIFPVPKVWARLPISAPITLANKALEGPINAPEKKMHTTVQWSVEARGTRAMGMMPINKLVMKIGTHRFWPIAR